MSETPNIGERVRVTIEGDVMTVDAYNGDFFVRERDNQRGTWVSPRNATSIERLAPNLPTTYGSVVRATRPITGSKTTLIFDGVLWRYANGKPVTSATLAHFRDFEVVFEPSVTLDPKREPKKEPNRCSMGCCE